MARRGVKDTRKLLELDMIFSEIISRRRKMKKGRFSFLLIPTLTLILIFSGACSRGPKSLLKNSFRQEQNGWIELAWYYVPYLEEKEKSGAADNRAPSYCSAFIATGSYTADGQIVIGHNAWVEYIVGERWNIIADIVPQEGFRILMDSFPRYIHSGDDFVITNASLLYTETTISQFKGFREDGTPEFMRARKAAQYASSIDEFIKIMTTNNNGAYANDWLVSDLKSNEIARLELGLKNQHVWRTRDGYFVGSNFPSDEKLITEETTFNPNDPNLSVLVRKARWENCLSLTISMPAPVLCLQTVILFVAMLTKIPKGCPNSAGPLIFQEVLYREKSPRRRLPGS